MESNHVYNFEDPGTLRHFQVAERGRGIGRTSVIGFSDFSYEESEELTPQSPLNER